MRVMQRPKKSPPAKLLALTLTFAMLLGIAITAAAAPAYPDISGHWGETAIEKWSAYDVLHGNDLGTFDPDGELDVTQLAQILVNTFGYTESYTGSLPGYTSSWGEEAVRKAVAAGAIEAGEATLPLTRELAAKIVAKAFGISPIADKSKFTDDDAISVKYKPYASALGKANIFNGSDGKLMPADKFTRAQIIQALDNAVTSIVKEDKAAEAAKSVIINTGDVTLGEGTIEGDLIIAQGVGDGDITLDGVTVKGRLVIFGGGADSIHVKGKSSVSNVVVSKTFGQAARFVVESADATVGTVTVLAESKATVETTGEATIAKIEVVPVTEVSETGEVAAKTETTVATTVTIAAKAETVAIAAEKAELTLTSGAAIENLAIDAVAENATLTVSSGAAVEKLAIETKAEVTVASGATVTTATVAASDVKISGEGKVAEVTVTENAKTGVEVGTGGTNITVSEDAGSVATSEGKTVVAGDTVKTEGSGVGVADTPPAVTEPKTDTGSGNGGGGVSDPPPVITTYYTITFASNGGDEVASKSVASGNKVTAPAAPAKAGYDFAGWYSDIALTTAYDFDTAVRANITLYAKWTSIALTVQSALSYADLAETLTLTFSDAVLPANTTIASDVATPVWGTDNKSVVITPVSIGKTEIPALTFTSAINGATVDSAAATLYKVAEEATRASLTGTVKVLFADSDRPFAQINSGSDKWVHFAGDADILNILRAVYVPNAAGADAGKNAKAVALFHINIASVASEDLIKVKGTDIPAGESTAAPFEIQVGIPNANNSNLPDFVIPPDELGASNSTLYTTTRIVVNKGAYLNIDSNQSFEMVFGGAQGSPGTGNFRNGNITVMNGGKLRDSAYKLWPLGSGSTLSILEGGFLAVGKGNNNGEWADAAVTDEPTALKAAEWYGGWLIGDASATIWLGGGATTESFTDAIEVRDGFVMLNGYAIVQKDLNLMYDTLLTRGSQVTIASDVTVGMPAGKMDGSYEFYGQPSTVSPSFTTPNDSDPSKLVLKPGAMIYDDYTKAVLVQNSGQGDDVTVSTMGEAIGVNGGWTNAGTFHKFTYPSV